MEEDCSPDILSLSPTAAPGFQANRFVKINSNLNIPDTIEEQSGELCTNGSKMDAQKLSIGSYADSVNESLQFSHSDESSIASTIIPFDNSFLADCERKLLECNSSDDDDEGKCANSSKQNLENSIHFNSFSRKLGFNNETISTPPTELRKQIHVLRDEMAESHEFHDLEIQILREKLEEKDPENYDQLIEQYSTLLDMYTTLKKEYEEYRNEQDRLRDEIHDRTAHCLENLCSQIEASDSSITFSEGSFADVKCSTVVGNITEAEITVPNVTLTTNDPLRMSGHSAVFKTPKLTPLRSAKKRVLHDSNLIKFTPVKNNSNLMDFSQLGNKKDNLNVSLGVKSIRLETDPLETSLNGALEIQTLQEANDVLQTRVDECQRIINELQTNKQELERRISEAEAKVLESNNVKRLYEEAVAEVAKISSEKSKLSDLETTVSQLQTQILNFENEKAEFLSNYKKLEEEASALRSEICNLESLKSSYDEMKVENENLSQIRLLYNQAEIEMANLKKAFADENSDLSQLRETIVQLECQILTVEKEKSDLLQRYQKLQDESTAWRLDMNNLENLRTSYEELKTEKESLSESNKKSEENIAVMREELTKKMSEAEETVRELENVKRMYEEAQGEITKLSTENSELTQARQVMSSLQTQITTMETEKSELLDKYKTLNEEASAMRLEMNNLESQKSSYGSDMAQANEVVSSLQAQITTMETEKSELMEKYKALDEEASAMRLQVNNLESQKSSYGSDLTQANEAVALLQAQITTMETEKSDLMDRYKTLDEEASAMRLELNNMESLKSSYEELKLENEELSDCNKRSDEAISVLQQELETVQEQLKGKLTEAESSYLEELKNLKVLYKQSEIERENLSSVKSDLAEAEGTISQLQAQIQSFEVEKSQILDKCQKLEEELSVVRLEVAKLDSLKSSYEELKVEKEELSNCSRKSGEEIVALNEQLQNAKEELRQNAQAAEVATLELQNVRKMYEEAESQIEKLSTVSSDFCQTQVTNLQLRSQLTDCEAENLDLLSKCQELEAETSVLRSQVNNYENLKTSYDDMKLENVELHGFREKSEGVISGLQKELQSIEEELEKSRACTEAAVKDLENFKGLYEEVEAKNRKSEEAITTLREELMGQLSGVEGTQEELENLKRLYRDAEIDAAAKLSSLQSELNEARATVSILQAQLLDFQTEKADLLNKGQTLEDELNSLKDLKSVHEAMKIEREELRTTSEGVIATLKQDLMAKVSEAEATMRELENLKELYQRAEAEIANLSSVKSDLNQTQETVVLLQTKIADLETERAELLGKYQKLEEDTMVLRNQIQDLENLRSSYEDLKVENEKLNGVKTESENVISALREELSVKMSETEKTIQELENVRSLYSQTEVEMASLKKAFADENSDLSRLREAIAKLECQILTVETEKSDLLERYQKLEEESSALRLDVNNLENLRTSYEELKTEKESLSESNKKSEEDIAVMREKLTKKMSEVEETVRELENVKRLYEEAQGEITKLSSENSELTQAREVMSSLQSQITTMETEKSELVNKYNTLNEEASAMRLEMNNLESQKSSYGSDLAQANETVALLQAQITSMETEKSELMGKYKALDEEASTMRLELNNMESLKSSYEELKIGNEELSNCNKRSDEAISVLQQELQSARDELNLKITANEVQIAELENYKSLYERVEGQIAALSSENANLKANVDDLGSACKRSEEEATALRDELMKRKSEADLSSRGLEELKGLYEEAKAEITKLTAENSDLCHLRQAMSLLQAQVGDFENEKTELLARHQVLENQASGLKSQIKELENLKSAYEDVKLENEELTDFNKKLDDVVTALKDELDSAKLKSEGNEVLLQEMMSIRGENDRFKHLFSVLVDNKYSLAEICRTVASDGTDVGFKKAAEKIQNLVSDPLDEVPFLSVISDLILECCQSIQRELTEAFEREVKIELNGRLEEAMMENTAKQKRVDDLLREIESLKRDIDESESLSNQVKALEGDKTRLMEVLMDVQTCLDMPADTVSNLLSGHDVNVFSEKIRAHAKAQTDALAAENTNLKLSNDNLKEKVKELSKLVNEMASRQESSTPGNGLPSHGKVLRSSSGRGDLCARRLDKLEEINHNLTELVTRVLSMTDFANVDKLKFNSVRDYSNVSKKVVSHFEQFLSRVKELESANDKLDEECDSYAKTIKDLKKEAVTVWKANKDKWMSLEAEVRSLKKEKAALESEKDELVARISKLDAECQKLTAAKGDGNSGSCNCANELKKVHDLKRMILIKEQKILELQDLEKRNSSFKSEIKYLENALEQEKKKVRLEKEQNKKLQQEIADLSKNGQKTAADRKNAEDYEMLDELRMRGTVSGGVVQEFMEKEKARKLSKDIGILKELCRARYAEIKRLEAENASLKSSKIQKHSNQLDSPLRVNNYNTRSKSVGKESAWKPEVGGKENMT